MNIENQLYFLLENIIDDIELASRIVKGDPEAENYLFSYYEERIRYLVRGRLRRTVSREDKEEIISKINQAILVSLRNNGYKPELNKPLEAYIAGIAGNVIAQYFRDIKKNIKTEDIDAHRNIANPVNASTEIAEEERKEQIERCLKRIKPKYAEVLLLRYYEDKSIEDIAEHLNIERRRVSERINYAIKLLLKKCSKEKFFQ